MLIQLKTFKGNAVAVELVDSFTETDVELLKKLFEEKLSQGYKHVNILVKVQDMSLMKKMDMKAFVNGEIWGIKHFGKIGKCAVVSHSDFIKAVVKVENKILHLINHALEERYFDISELDEALEFINPD
ncbi:MAG: STAS/SEC14 domain-containing protein [Flavobacteriaceae bacterium]|jgi:hypothetical protein|nr:STAS/SEC14 domain-containing protein [Flavobacteriaceae bacterium]